METLLKLADVFILLPEEQQKVVLDFTHFLLHKYKAEILKPEEQINDNSSDLEPSDELMTLLKERLDQHRKNPQLSKKWKDLKKELLEKY
jgi:hypothetical protein